MPIKISRQTGEIISATEYTQDQKDKVWEIVVREWVEQNPELPKQPIKEDKKKNWATRTKP